MAIKRKIVSREQIKKQADEKQDETILSEEKPTRVISNLYDRERNSVHPVISNGIQSFYDSLNDESEEEQRQTLLQELRVCLDREESMKRSLCAVGAHLCYFFKVGKVKNGSYSDSFELLDDDDYVDHFMVAYCVFCERVVDVTAYSLFQRNQFDAVQYREMKVPEYQWGEFEDFVSLHMEEFTVERDDVKLELDLYLDDSRFDLLDEEFHFLRYNIPEAKEIVHNLVCVAMPRTDEVLDNLHLVESRMQSMLGNVRR